MDTHLIQKFERIGARAKIEFLPSRWSNPWRGRPQLLHPNFSIDIGNDKHGQYFKLSVPEQNIPELEVLDVQRNLRHLLLLARQDGNKDKILCGHDERHWFTCAVPGQSASTVLTAMKALQPEEVRSHNLSRKELLSRKNSQFIRQGEWFFIPEPRLIVSEKIVLHHEPISRGRGKAHWLENAYRTGGELVYVNNDYPLGLIESEYKALIANKPSAGGIKNWRTMRRNAAVYARGAVSHPDHATIYLRGWHQVIMNTEHQARAAKNIVFLD
jgi:hypothetical protein